MQGCHFIKGALFVVSFHEGYPVLLVVQQNKKTMTYTWVYSDVLINSFVCVFHSDPDASSFMFPRMDRPGHWTQWNHRQYVEIVRMDSTRNRVRILVENERVARLQRESQGLAVFLAQLRADGF